MRTPYTECATLAAGVDRDVFASEISWKLPPLSAAPADEDLLVAAILDADAYRTVVQSALHHIHRQQVELDRIRVDCDRLRQENRALREGMPRCS